MHGLLIGSSASVLAIVTATSAQMCYVSATVAAAHAQQVYDYGDNGKPLQRYLSEKQKAHFIAGLSYGSCRDDGEYRCRRADAAQLALGLVEMPSQLPALLVRPWTVLSYMFSQYDYEKAEYHSAEMGEMGYAVRCRA